MDGRTLNLYGVTDKVRPILDVFTEDTGIKIEHLTMKNGEILQRLKNENESSNGKDLDDIMKDPHHYWYGTSLTLVNWVVNTDLLKKKGLETPQNWDDLLQDDLKGQILNSL